ncbi:MAG: DUF4124 domain-containing protein [Thermodesulfobacteriota bacterium]
MRTVKSCLCCGAVSALILLCSPVHAEMYRYVDESGTVRYTDDLSRVPTDQLAQPPAALPAPAAPAAAAKRSETAAILELRPPLGIPESELVELAAQKARLMEEIRYVGDRFREARRNDSAEREQELRKELLHLNSELDTLRRSAVEKNGGTPPPGWDD